ncbi:hypothetical protein OS493_024481 [Desmophyllum pertusum]|uniref:G-protein coupled receptors family 2 profile 2 domain-containing protein n=1 Tax=Desmophyllum pertusum TaxID=174260 RepID=A0A9X0CFD6_9CNID|nr:hypothetical protein OS493_024481 [Desmophyllum pertusum]
MIVPVLSSDYCPAVTNFNLQLPRVSQGVNITKDCSAINSSWTGKLTARCMRNAGGNSSWQYRQNCGCEIKTVLQYYEMQVSSVNMANFMEVANELEKAYTNFTSQKIYQDLLTTLKTSTCKKTPSIKSPEWDQIYTYCRINNLDTGIVIPSFTGSTPEPNNGEAIVDLGESSCQENLSRIVNNTLASVTSSGCTVASYYVNNGTITIRAKVDSTRMAKQNKTREVLELVLISVSLVGITCSLIMLSCIRKQSSLTTEKLFIHKNLLLSWGIGYAVYIVDITAFKSRNERTATCTAVAVIRHFFQTAVFTWMLVEAVNLFIKLVKVISTRTFYITYLAIGWGIPAVIVGITAAARTETYNMSQAIIKDFMCGSIKFSAKIERASCWLNGSKWLYTGPVCAILLVNLAIFVMLLNVVLGKVATKYNNDKIMKPGHHLLYISLHTG